MKVFISHSLAPTDLQVAILLTRQAEAKGILVESSQHQAPAFESIQVTQQSILQCNFVIAIVSLDSPYASNVQQDLVAAAKLGKPVLALVERGVPAFHVLPGVQYVEFVRQDLGPALANLSSILEKRKNQENLGNWIVGGGLALLALYLISKAES